ncbi:MAG: hypothetical protein ACXW27_08935 [Allosphingosinicella sp.]
MPDRSRLTVLLQEAPTIEIDDNGDVHVRDEGGPISVDRVMSIHSLMVYVRRGERALAEWQVRNGPLPEE